MQVYKVAIDAGRNEQQLVCRYIIEKELPGKEFFSITNYQFLLLEGERN